MADMLQVYERIETVVKYSLLVTVLLAAPAAAQTLRDLPYPDKVDGLEVMRQVYFVNRHFAFDNIFIGTKTGPVRMILKHGDRLNTKNTLIRSLNNRPGSSAKLFEDKVYFPSGKVRGTAILVVSYLDRPAAYSIWLPELRKVRRVSEPAHDDRWGGSPLTYGDVYFRQPAHEDHELQESKVFTECLDTLELDNQEVALLKDKLPEQSCYPKGREIYQIKSTTTFKNWWYDYRIVTVDQETFADYRSDYYKAGQRVKRVEKDWRPVAEHDRRAIMWRYWFAEDYRLGQQAIGYISPKYVQWNQQVDPRDWSERALRKIKR